VARCEGGGGRRVPTGGVGGVVDGNHPDCNDLNCGDPPVEWGWTDHPRVVERIWNGVHPSARHRDTGWMEHIVRVASREVYRSRWLTMREDQIRRLDGSYGSYGVIDKPDYALVIARDGDRFCLVEQFRYPLGLRRWEFPQGTAPDLVDVEPAVLAERELREETGLRAESMVFLGLLDVAAGMSSQRGRVFLATGITEGQHEREHEEQDMHSAWFSRGELEQMIVDGEITDAQSIAAWALFLLVPRA
jgi:8-oxo-dGDP phosphatase